MKLNISLTLHCDKPIEIHVHGLAESNRLEAFGAKLTTLVKGVHDMAGELQRLTDEVNQARTVIAGAKTLIVNLAQRIRDNATDPAALTGLADSLDSDVNDLAAAVEANTPAEGTGEGGGTTEPGPGDQV